LEIPLPSVSPRAAPRILLVDDAPDVLRVHSRFLKAAGMEILTADNGTLALAVAHHAVPDVIVTDVDMPDMDGLDLCRRLRADASTRGVGVVVVTGDSYAYARAALAAGCNAVLPKPCSRMLLLTTVRRLLARKAD
jgi:two-component system cell cycle response regulator